MHVELAHTDLTRALSHLSRIPGKHPFSEHLQSVLIDAAGDTVSLAATDLERSLRLELPARVETAGRIAVPVKRFAEYVATLLNAPVTLELAKSSLEVRSGRSSARLDTLRADDFPLLAERTDPTFTVATAPLRAALQRVTFAAAKDDSRPVLGGVYWQLLPGSLLSLAAADGFRLSVETLPVYNLEETAGPAAIVPVRALTELARLLPSDDDAPDLEITIEPGKRIAFAVPGALLQSQLIAGTYPNYPDLIPDMSEISGVTLDAADLRQAVRQAAVFSREGNLITRCWTAPDGFHISGQAEQIGTTETVLPADVPEESFRVALNARFLLDLLGVLAGPVTLWVKSPTNPVLLRAENFPAFTHVVMPMFVSDRDWPAAATREAVPA